MIFFSNRLREIIIIIIIMVISINVIRFNSTIALLVLQCRRIFFLFVQD